MSTDPSTLHQHNGKPVPWVTRWSGEVIEDMPIVTGSKGPGGVRWAYDDGNEIRENSGLLWLREGLNRSGRPLYADYNTYRQRACMARGKCQVCGSRIDGRPIRWLLPTAEANKVEENGTVRTTTPPTCEECIPVALELCPALTKMGWTLLKVLEYEVWGVFGNVVVLDRERNVVQNLPLMDIGYETPWLLEQTLARQQVVAFTKFVVEETQEGKQ